MLFQQILSRVILWVGGLTKKKHVNKQAAAALALVVLAVISVSFLMGFDAITGFITADAPLNSAGGQSSTEGGEQPGEQITLPDGDIPSYESDDSNDLGKEETPPDDDQPKQKPKINYIGGGSSSFSSQPGTEPDSAQKIDPELQDQIEENPSRRIPIIISLSGFENAGQMVENLKAAEGSLIETFDTGDIVIAYMEAGKVQEIARLAGIKKIFPEREMTALSEGVDHGMEQIGVPAAWELGYKGAGIKIAALIPYTSSRSAINFFQKYKITISEKQSVFYKES